MIRYRQDRVVSSRCGQLRDEVHSNSLEGERMFGGDRNHSGFKGSSVDFAFLASGAALDILLNVLFHAGPPEVSFGEGVGIGNSRVSGGRIIMEKLNYPPLQIVVTGNDGLGPLPPVSVLAYELVGVCPSLNQWLSTVVDLVSHYSVMDRLVISDIVFVLGKSLPLFWVVGICPLSSS